MEKPHPHLYNSTHIMLFIRRRISRDPTFLSDIANYRFIGIPGASPLNISVSVIEKMVGMNILVD